MFPSIIPARAHVCIVLLVGVVGLVFVLSPHQSAVVLLAIPYGLWLAWRLAIMYVLLVLGCHLLGQVLAGLLGQEVDRG